MRRLGVVLLVGLAIAGALLVGSGERRAPGGGPAVALASPSYRVFLPLVARRLRPIAPTPYGVTMYGMVDDAAGLTQMLEANASWVVTLLDWSQIEPVKGQRNWSDFDRKVQNAQAAGMEVFVLLVNNPSWASANPNGPLNNIQDLVDFVSAAADRYNCDRLGTPCVRYWSFYPEPDHKTRFGHMPVAMAQIMAAVTPAIKARMPSATVMVGGLAYDWFETDCDPVTGRCGPFVQSFLAGTLAALNQIGGGPGQARRYLDAVAFHYYPINPRWPTIREKAQEIRQIMNGYGVGDLPLYVPEMGHWSAPAAASSEDYQARRLVEMFVLGQAAGVRRLAWFEVFDARQGDTEEHGLFWGRDLRRPKKAYWAYRTLTSQLNGYIYDRPLATGQVEAHVFRSASGREKTVVWSQPKDTPGIFTLLGTCLRVVDTIGQVSQASGGGQITLTLPANEVLFVEGCS
jgi:hypothetical protein